MATHPRTGVLGFFDRIGRMENITSGQPGDEEPYLRRWTVWGRRSRTPGKRSGWRSYLHHFLRSDWTRCMHDHPNGLLSIMLWGSYIEHSPGKPPRTFRAPRIRWFPAEHTHRIEVKKPNCWTLVIMTPKKRPWGFWVTNTENRRTWIPWRKYIEGGGGGCD